MFEVGVELNTSCLKERDARVEQKMRGRPREREKERQGWSGDAGWLWGCWGSREKGFMRKRCTWREICGKNVRFSCITRKEMQKEGLKGSLQWDKADSAVEIENRKKTRWKLMKTYKLNRNV